MRKPIPEGWDSVTLGEVTQEVNDRVGPRKGVRVLSSTKHHGLVPSDEYFKNRTIYSSDTSNYKLVRRGEFAYATNHLAEGSIGLQERFGEACVSPIYTVFKCGEGVYEPYFFRLLKSDPVSAHYKLHEQASVDRRGAVRYRDFSRIPVALPPVVEQRRVSEVLDLVDESIFQGERAVAKISVVKDAVLGGIIKARGFGVLADSEIKFDTSGWVRFGDGSARDSRWSVLPCSDVIKLSGGSPKLLEESKSTGFPVYGGNGVIGYTESPFVAGDVIIIGRVGQYSGSVHYSNSPAWVTDNALYSRRVFGDWDKKFLAIYLRWFDLRKSQSLNDNPLVTQASIARVPVLQPPLEEQRYIVSIVEGHDERIAAECARLEKLRKLKAGLMDDLLTGRVRVNQLKGLPV